MTKMLTPRPSMVTTSSSRCLVAAALLAAALVRLVLPERRAGLLASRGRALDVTTLAVLGAAVLAVAAWLP